MKVIPMLRDKIMKMGNHYPLYKFYNQILDTLNKMSLEQYSRFYSQWERENQALVPVYAFAKKTRRFR